MHIRDVHGSQCPNRRTALQAVKLSQSPNQIQELAFRIGAVNFALFIDQTVFVVIAGFHLLKLDSAAAVKKSHCPYLGENISESIFQPSVLPS